MKEEYNPYQFPLESDSARQRRVSAEVVHVETQEEQQEEQEPLSAEREAEIEEEKRREERQRAREANVFWQFISGNWLILDGITGTYRYLLIVAAALFLSVVSIFYSFHLGEKYTRRSSEVQLLRERSLEYQRVRFNATSHTAILKELKRRNIPIYDIQESKTIIEK